MIDLGLKYRVQWWLLLCLLEYKLRVASYLHFIFVEKSQQSQKSCIVSTESIGIDTNRTYCPNYLPPQNFMFRGFTNELLTTESHFQELPTYYKRAVKDTYIFIAGMV